FHPEQDGELEKDGLVGLLPYRSYNGNSAVRLGTAFLNRVMGCYEAGQKFVQSPLWEKLERDSLCLNIGGDTYCYDRPTVSYGLNRFAYRHGVKTILWGCSIEKDGIDREMLRDLGRYTLIFPRESITRENLIEAGMEPARLILTSDPAFALGMQPTELPDCFEAGNTVGINLSDLAVGMESDRGIVCANYRAVIRYILNNTDMCVALIPHVYDARTGNGDLLVLKELYQEFESSRRVSLVGEERNCMQLKYIISKCRFFLGARTHSVIAAYSGCVPTLAVGYSVKSQGIARDIFGEYRDLVVSVRQLRAEDELRDRFVRLTERETKIREQYREVLPGYIQRAYAAGRRIRRLWKGE
ncbi:MAG TPA: polysaccharide pyruvyl transferase family protein, partial [Clostridia bacterium]|nr:polysaccharide pyruvyl transferase family protein [Clostridia bacterium]